MVPAVLTRLRTLVRGYRWQWLDPAANREEIDIPMLISPLRVDAIILRDFIQFYLAYGALAERDFPQFVAAARGQRFYDWKFASHSIREPATTRSAEVFAPYFADEVRRVLDIWHALAAGFDPRRPIEVRVAGRVLPAASGKRLRARYILGDGSHRLACLMVQGLSRLPRDYYRLRRYRRYRPFDATAILTSRGLLPEREYITFLSEVYGAPQPHLDRRSFLRYIRDARPAEEAEVRTMLRLDGFPV